MDINTPSITNKYWQLPDENNELDQLLAMQTHISPLNISILRNRGITEPSDIEQFLKPRLKNSLPDPFTFLDMHKGVDLLIKAIKTQQKIVIWGDYDVDGATSSAILYDYLHHKCHAQVESYIPDRLKEGYGPNIPALEKLVADGAEVIISVDCGITAFDPIKRVKQLGGQFIVLDHHVSEDSLPPADAIINPNRHDENKQYGYCAAVGVCFIFLVGLQKKLREMGFFNGGEPNLMDYLDIVALGTVADVVPLVGLNRVFVAQGLAKFHQNPHLGMLELAQTAGCANMNAGVIGFQLGPRINAGGRIGKSSLGFELLTTPAPLTRQEIALELHILNEQRKSLEQEICEHAIAMAENYNPDHQFIICGGDKWHLGVVGIVASRIKDRFLKPSMAIAWVGDVGHGSARSVRGVHIGNAIIQAKNHGLLLSGGGHAMAAGFKIQRQNLPAFAQFLYEYFQNLGIHESPKTIVAVDACLPIQSLTSELVGQLAQLEPFGAGHSEPVILVKNCILQQVNWFKDKHFQATFSDELGQKKCRTIIFNATHSPLAQTLATARKNTRFHIVGSARISDYNGGIDFFIEDACYG